MSNNTNYDLYDNETLNANHVHGGAARYAVAVLLVMVYFAVLLANYGIIYYEWVSTSSTIYGYCDLRTRISTEINKSYSKEAPGLYRTLINKLVPQASVHNMLLATIFLPTLTARLLLPNVVLPRVFCLAKRFCYVSVGAQLILTYNEIAWLRYFYLGLGNLGSIDEDLVGRFLVIMNVLIGTCLAVGRIMLPGAHHDLQRFCQDASTRTDEEGTLKFKITTFFNSIYSTGV